jgi:hypothetical protein
VKAILIFFFFFFFFFLPILEEMEKSRRIGLNDEGQEEDMDIQFFDLSTITKATDNFLINNKLEESGFGPVYRVN